MTSIHQLCKPSIACQAHIKKCSAARSTALKNQRHALAVGPFCNRLWTAKKCLTKKDWKVEHQEAQFHLTFHSQQWSNRVNHMLSVKVMLSVKDMTAQHWIWDGSLKQNKKEMKRTHDLKIEGGSKLHWKNGSVIWDVTLRQGDARVRIYAWVIHSSFHK